MSQRSAKIAAIAGGAMTVLGPISGIALTALFTSRAFSTAGSVPAEGRAAHVASGIDGAMNYTIAGSAVGVIGLVIVIASLVVLLRSRSGRATA